MKTNSVCIFTLAIALTSLTACSDKEPPAPAPTSTAPAPAPQVKAEPTPRTDSVPLLKSSQATFTAKLPCKDCPGIELSINLQRDERGGNSFVLNFQRMERDATPAVISGNWDLGASQIDNRPAAVVTLNPGNPGRSARLRINNDNSMTLIDGKLNGIDANDRPVFQRASGDLDLQELYQDELSTQSDPDTEKQ